MVLVVICFQQTIFDNEVGSLSEVTTVVICFQQTIFDNFTLTFYLENAVVICFQQTIFDNGAYLFDFTTFVVICFQQTIFDNLIWALNAENQTVIGDQGAKKRPVVKKISLCGLKSAGAFVFAEFQQIPYSVSQDVIQRFHGKRQVRRPDIAELLNKPVLGHRANVKYKHLRFAFQTGCS